MYWGKTYDPNAAGGDIPVCWSDNGTAPSSQAATPQSPQCMSCPHNAIGSAISKFSGAKIKACVDMKKLAFIVPGDPDNMIFLMTVKPGSFKNWQTYINFLKAQKFTDGSSPDLSDLVTRLEFESQGVLKFSPVAPVPGNQALLAQREAAWAKGTSGDIVGQNDVPYSGQLAAPAQTQQLPPPPAPPAAVNQAPTGFAPSPSPSAMSMTPNTVAQDGGATTASPSKRRGRKPGATAENGFQAPNPAPTAFMAQPNPQPAQAPAPSVPPAQQAPSTTGQAADPLDIPAFLQRTPPTTPPPVAPAGQGAASGTAFGMTTPAAPDQAMQDAIAKAFALPT